MVENSTNNVPLLRAAGAVCLRTWNSKHPFEMRCPVFVFKVCRKRGTREGGREFVVAKRGPGRDCTQQGTEVQSCYCVIFCVQNHTKTTQRESEDSGTALCCMYYHRYMFLHKDFAIFSKQILKAHIPLDVTFILKKSHSPFFYHPL